MTESQDDEVIILPSLMSYRDIAYHDFVPPPAGAIEARAARRRQRKIVTGAAVSAALIGVSAILLVKAAPPVDGPPVANSSSPAVESNPTSSPTPATSPPPSGGPTSGPEVVPVTAMLTGLDLWDGGGAYTDGVETGDWQLASLRVYCTRAKNGSYPGPPPARSGARERTLIKAGIQVAERVELSDVDYQVWTFQRHREFVADCADFTAGSNRYRLQIIAEGFAGQESFIVRSGEMNWVLVRQGELSTQILFKNGQSEAEMRSAGLKAAIRMCHVTPDC